MSAKCFAAKEVISTLFRFNSLQTQNKSMCLCSPKLFTANLWRVRG